MANAEISALVRHAVRCGLISREDSLCAANRLLEAMRLDEYEPAEPASGTLAELLDALTADAVSPRASARTTYRRPRPVRHEAHGRAHALAARGQLALPRAVRHVSRARPRPTGSTASARTSNYIRRDRIARDVKWLYPSEYGDARHHDQPLEAREGPEGHRRRPARRRRRAIPSASSAGKTRATRGRLNHPARQNLRIIPLSLAGESWYFQYSPYVYYNEHCIVFSSKTTRPMKITARRSTGCWTSRQFPHYFVGSNADLPIVGGSILSHDHFQGGHYDFAMAKARLSRRPSFADFPEISRPAIVAWPMSVVRLTGSEPRSAWSELAERDLSAPGAAYSDPSVGILAESDGSRTTP
jgi:UDPglucose--hexose-1-phosphate uridylyltransferase